MLEWVTNLNQRSLTWTKTKYLLVHEPKYDDPDLDTDRWKRSNNQKKQKENFRYRIHAQRLKDDPEVVFWGVNVREVV